MLIFNFEQKASDIKRFNWSVETLFKIFTRNNSR